MKTPALLDLRPTQFVLGMNEVNSKNLKIAKMNKKELSTYCNQHKVPVVIGPHKDLYMIDHHHFVRACWEQKVVGYEVLMIKDLSHKTEKEFWNSMIKNGWVYLKDQFGLGPHSPLSLPTDIRGLADDPFRSLVWELIDRGVIKKDKTPFFEFQWAQLMRLNLNLPLHSKSNFKKAINTATAIAKGKSAAHLPGYRAK